MAAWNPAARLECVSCGAGQELGPAFTGCGSCGGPLVVGYGPGTPIADRLPLARSELAGLGQGSTPLVELPGGDGVWLKLELVSPTGSHKARFHAVAAGAARALGCPGMVTSSTGNHGAAGAAYAAAAGLRCVVCLNPASPPALASQIRAYGAEVAVIPGEAPRLIGALVDRGWFPATAADPGLVGRSTPYGLDGYRAIAHEIAEALGSPPACVAVPAAGGDTVYGIWRGFRDLAERDGAAVPTILACQPEEAAPLVLTAERGAAEPQTVADPRSVALSAADARSGWHATLALREAGAAVAVPEPELEAAVRRLARGGILVEPASALALAGYERARADGRAPAGPAVIVLTSSGLGWIRDVDTAIGEAPPPFRSVEEALRAVR